jgi:integral membrane protein
MTITRALHLAAHVRDDPVKLPPAMPIKNPVSTLRSIAFVEGVSFLLLLGIAMPLKYLADLPVAVKIVGWIHGVLFVALCISLLQTMIVARWPMTRAALVFVGALLPFGPFLLNRRMWQYEKEFAGRTARE